MDTIYINLRPYTLNQEIGRRNGWITFNVKNEKGQITSQHSLPENFFDQRASGMIVTGGNTYQWKRDTFQKLS